MIEKNQQIGEYLAPMVKVVELSVRSAIMNVSGDETDGYSRETPDWF